MTVALYVFVLVVIADVVGLILDLSLYLSGQRRSQQRPGRTGGLH